MAELSTIVRNTCRTPNAGADAPTFQVTTTANPKQKRALELVNEILASALDAHNEPTVQSDTVFFK